MFPGSLILATSTADYMMSDFSCYGHSAKGLWEHSLAVASGAKTLGKTIGLNQEAQEELFIAGLLHDIGKMLVGPYLQERNIGFASGSDEMVKVERDTIGIDHAEAGALVAAKWNLSTMVQELLRSHHDAGDVPEESVIHLAILKISDAIAHEAMAGYRQECRPATAISAEDRAMIGAAGVNWEETKVHVQEAMESALAGLSKICS